MSYRILGFLLALTLVLPAASGAQSTAQSLSPSPNSAALLPYRSALAFSPDRQPSEIPTQFSGGRGASSTLMTAVVLAGASLGGLWAGRQAPLPPADDDSDLSVGHLVTAPVASMVTVWAASALLGRDHSLRGAVLGAIAGAGAGLLASMATSDEGVVITYIGVHGLVTALLTR